MIDRFAQIAPKLVFAVNGYRNGGRDFNRSADLGHILAARPPVQTVVMLDDLPGVPLLPTTLRWDDLLSGPDVPRAAFPDARLLWRIPDETRTFVMGVAPVFARMVRGQGVVPMQEFELQALQAVMRVGSLATPEIFDWENRAVKADVWVASQSGGTEFCSGLLAGSPLLPITAPVKFRPQRWVWQPKPLMMTATRWSMPRVNL